MSATMTGTAVSSSALDRQRHEPPGRPTMVCARLRSPHLLCSCAAVLALPPEIDREILLDKRGRQPSAANGSVRWCCAPVSWAVVT